jgi:hypothetical protein
MRFCNVSGWVAGGRAILFGGGGKRNKNATVDNEREGMERGRERDLVEGCVCVHLVCLQVDGREKEKQRRGKSLLYLPPPPNYPIE